MNCYRSRHVNQDVVPMNIQHMVFFAGMRGIVSYACANIFSNINNHQPYILATTTSIAMITLFVQGSFSLSTMKFLNIETGVDHKSNNYSSSPLLSPNRIVIKSLNDFEKKLIYPLGIWPILHVYMADASKSHTFSYQKIRKHLFGD